MKVRSSVKRICERCKIVRRHGVGTFVAASEPVIEAGLEVLESLDHMAQRLGLTTQVSHLESVERWATPAEGASCDRCGVDLLLNGQDNVQA